MGLEVPKDCGCSDGTIANSPEERAAAFYNRRERCPALKLTIPDNVFQKHFEFSISPPDDAYRCSVPLLAYCGGHLSAFTGLLHGYVLDGDQPRADLTPQYRNDLRERWFLEPDTTSRYRSARLYQSRLAELAFVRWLERNKWKISSLEAYGGTFDVSAVSSTGQNVDFEIKFLAQREVVFELNRASFQSPTAGWLGMYSPIDYLLFRVYQAACQLERATATRIVVVIVKDYQVSYQIPLSGNWIDWKNPSFLRRDSEIETFLADQYKANTNLDSDVRHSIAAVDEVWVLRDKGLFELELAHRFSTKCE